MFKKIIFGLLVCVSASANDLFIDFKGDNVIIEKNGQIFVYKLTKADIESLTKGDSNAILRNICEKIKCPPEKAQ